MIEGKLTLTTPKCLSRQFVAVSGTGHALVMDDAEGDSAAKPIELALLALGGCTAFDVIGILRKKRQKMTRYEIELRVDQNPQPADSTRLIVKLLKQRTAFRILTALRADTQNCGKLLVRLPAAQRAEVGDGVMRKLHCWELFLLRRHPNWRCQQGD